VRDGLADHVIDLFTAAAPSGAAGLEIAGLNGDYRRTDQL
jgi:hypothetical protein